MIDLKELYRPSEKFTDPSAPFSCLLLGESGAGKTTLACTWPKPLVLDFNSGLKAVAGNADVLAYPFRKSENVFSDIKDLLISMRSRSGAAATDQVLADRRTVVIDDLTDLGKMTKARIMAKQSKDPTATKADYDTYGILLAQMEWIFDFCKDLGLNLVVCALPQKDESDSSGAKGIYPMIEGSFRQKAEAAFDEVYYLENRQSTRLLHTKPYGLYRAKSRFGLTEDLDVSKVGYPAIIEAFKRKAS